MGDRILREPDVKAITGLSRTTRWELERKGQFPKKKQLSSTAVGWLESDIQRWLETRPDAVDLGADLTFGEYGKLLKRVS